MHPSYIHAIVCCALVVGTPAIVSAQSSTSHWKFEETSGTTALDSNSSFHGTLVGGVSRLSVGRVGRAIGFDGINCVTVPDTPSLESAAFSAAAWVRRNGPQQPWARIISKGNGAAAPFGSYKFELDGASDSIVTWHLGFTDLSYVIVRAVTPLADGQWALLNGPPVTAAEAFTGTPRARIGSHQDCFLASTDDYGTWGRSGNTYAYDKAYVAENSKYAVVGGETCNPNPPRSSCPTALSELASMHWTYLNSEFEPNVLLGWIAGGCHDEIDRRLGYRFKLLSGAYSQSDQRGQPFEFGLQVFNEGFASMVNERPLFSVIYKGSESYTCELNTDPRWWAPNTTTTITGSCVLPPAMTTGTYSSALWLPDQSPSIQNNPLYAVRFANQGLWDATRGFNVLVSNITVTP